MTITVASEHAIRNNVVVDKSTLRQLVGLVVVTALVYIVFTYGGVRSPDSEVVFRTAEALATNHTFGLPKELRGMKSFGLPAGEDGRYYSIFGPGESVACLPFVEVGLWLNRTGWYKNIRDFVPVSHYVDIGIIYFVDGAAPLDVEPHALRFIVSFFNVFVGTLCVCFFFLILKLLTKSDAAAWCLSILFAFGSLMLPYSGTFFSEPLATLLVILSLYCLIWNDVTPEVSGSQMRFSLLCSALFLGMAITVHITAILYAPFFFAYGLYPFLRTSRSLKRSAISGAIFVAGVGLFLALLAYYNYVRFGNILQTGRTVMARVDYSDFVAPWRGLYGLLFGSGKGIVLYCPAAVISLFFWRPFHKRYPALSYTILASVFFRICFIASRSDWHGGFSLGPRYLVMAIPLLMIPYATVVTQWFQTRKTMSILVLFLLTLGCVAEQIYLSLGEIFSFLQITKWSYAARGIDVFRNDALYLDWNKSPLLYLLDAKRGPFIMRFLPLYNITLFWWLVGIAGVFLFLWYTSLMKEQDAPFH